TGGLNITSADATVAGACANESVITRTWTATDNCGNSETFDQIITIEDNTDPVITCPANQTQLAANGTDTVLIDYTSMATISDNCSSNANITVTQSPAIGSTQAVGTINVTLTATDECGNTANCNFDVEITNTTNIADNTRVNVSIFPNPNKGLFTIDLGTEMNGNVTIQVYNLLGEIVYNEEKENSNTSYHLDLQHVEKGIYYVSVKGAEKSIVKKIMIM
ncbi:MAG: T9SS type A sorting domain-containing protein, partial [Vicingaceae bacterium]